MSKNVVDSIIEFCKDTGETIGLIPSRRQVEYDGGYVNNWTTKDFSAYANYLPLKRDHAGPSQGYTDDDGFRSLKDDCKYFNLIHIDPWKKYPKYEEGLQWTVKMIDFCHDINPKVEFEVGTEEAIRRFEPEELSKLINDLKDKLSQQAFSRIKYLVIQSGTSLKGNLNTGCYDKNRLLKMINVARDYNLLSKEHNGDYMPVDLINEKMELGLDSINIAPEFGLVETQCYIDNGIDLEKFWKICYNSKRWEKWVDSSFDPFDNKTDLIKICGHYVLSSKDFIEIRPDIDNIIKDKIKDKLHKLHA